MRAGRVKERFLLLAPQHLAFIEPLNMNVTQGNVLPFVLQHEMTPGVFKERARTAFDYADEESTGSLNKRQYKVAMTAVFGYPPDKTEVKHVFQCIDRISYREFEHCVSKKCDTNNMHVNAEMLFTLLDKDYKGYLILEDFCSASKSAGLRVSSSVWQTVFKEMDRCKKGYIDFDEFLHVLPAV